MGRAHSDHRSPTTGHRDSRSFAARIIAWQKQHGLRDLPWLGARDPYRIWISEIMLQQTQVSAVIPYYGRFLTRFPDLASLAAASEDEVLQVWSGLGYYARARNLHRAARTIALDLDGSFPREHAAVWALPGIGRSTAAAICVFAYGARQAILDGNVKRVLARHFGIEGYPGDKRVEAALWEQSERLVPEQDTESYTQALMDLGASVCLRRSPRCTECPVRATCVAYRDGRIGQLPFPRPARPRPERSTTMVILSRHGELLLEKRPSAGVWGGLWCFPEMDGARVREECLGRYGLEVTALRSMDRIEHGFTHFRLHITPMLATVRPARAAQELGRLWLTPEDALGAAVPVPVKRILEALAREGGDEGRGSRDEGRGSRVEGRGSRVEGART